MLLVNRIWLSIGTIPYLWRGNSLQERKGRRLRNLISKFEETEDLFEEIEQGAEKLCIDYKLNSKLIVDDYVILDMISRMSERNKEKYTKTKSLKSPSFQRIFLHH